MRYVDRWIAIPAYTLLRKYYSYYAIQSYSINPYIILYIYSYIYIVKLYIYSKSQIIFIYLYIVKVKKSEIFFFNMK